MDRSRPLIRLTMFVTGSESNKSKRAKARPSWDRLPALKMTGEKDAKMRDYKYAYIMTSERGFSDETECKVMTDAEYRVGEWVERGDGLRWHVDMIVKGPSANLSMVRAAAQALVQSGWTWEAVCGYLRWAKDAGLIAKADALDIATDLFPIAE